MRLSGLSNKEVAAGWGDVAHALLDIGLPPAGMLRVVLPFAAVDYRSHSLHTHSPGLANRPGANGDGPKGAGTRRALVTIRQGWQIGPAPMATARRAQAQDAPSSPFARIGK